jgi:SprT-like protein
MLQTEAELTALARQLSLTWWQRPFAGTIHWNSRLRTSAGRYVVSSQIIELNQNYAENFGDQALAETIKHELIHYHFPQAGHGPVFRREARRVGCARFCQPLPGPVRWQVYQCRRCGALIRRRRRFDTKRFRCGNCGGIIKWMGSRLDDGPLEPRGGPRKVRS